MHRSAMDKPAIRPRRRLRGRSRGVAANRFLRLALALTLPVCAAFPVAMHAQQQSPLGSSRASQPSPTPIPPPSLDSTFQQRRLRALNAERQKELVSDTNKLLKLTSELNAEVSHNETGSFTPEQLRQLAKIEKLARSVKDKMCNPVQASIFEDDFPQPSIPPIGIP